MAGSSESSDTQRNAKQAKMCRQPSACAHGQGFVHTRRSPEKNVSRVNRHHERGRTEEPDPPEGVETSTEQVERGREFVLCLFVSGVCRDKGRSWTELAEASKKRQL